MLNSRNIDDLRPDVAKNCRTLIARAKAAGYAVLVTGTVRDDEFQQFVYEKGTGGKPPATFHSVKAGLAFDICQNVRGREYNDPAFWSDVSKIGKQIGFTWGGDWTGFVDKPHFQWDAKGKFTGRDIVAGRYPAPMPPAQEEEEDMTEEQVKVLVQGLLAAAQPRIFQTVEEVPEWGRATVDKLLKRGALSENAGKLEMSYDQLRVLVINDRSGLYGD